MAKVYSEQPDLSVFDPPNHRQRCGVGVAMEKLDPEQLALMKAGIAAPQIQHAMLALRLSEWSGIKIRSGTLMRHRRGGCSCE